MPCDDFIPKDAWESMSMSGINIYARCRTRHGYTQEAWAEDLNISVESVRRYELGQRVPPNAVVADMVELTGDYYVAYQHIRLRSLLLGVLPDVQERSLQDATIRLINRVLQFADQNRGRQLLQIAEDGKVDEEEQPLYREIMDELQRLVAAAYEMRYCTGEVRR